MTRKVYFNCIYKSSKYKTVKNSLGNCWMCYSIYSFSVWNVTYFHEISVEGGRNVYKLLFKRVLLLPFLFVLSILNEEGKYRKIEINYEIHFYFSVQYMFLIKKKLVHSPIQYIKCCWSYRTASFTRQDNLRCFF